MSGRRTQSRGLLVLGAALIALSQMRWGIGILAFVAPVPLLLYMRTTSGWRSRGLVMLAVWAGYTLATMKLVTEPLPWMFGFAFALPFGILYGLLYLGSDAIRRLTSDLAGVIAFPAMMVVGEYVMHRFTPFGSWAAAGYTQLENLPLLQLSSLVGLAGVSFIVYLLPAAIAPALVRAPNSRQAAIGAFSLLIAATAYGSLRLHAARSAETVQVAAIGTDGTIGGWPLPPQEELDRVNDGLFARTAEAARRGARLVAWNEAANAVLPHNEPSYIERIQSSARDHRIELVASYIVPDDATHTYRNKYVWVRPDGSIDHTYHKHNPVPGEPAEKGTEPFGVVETEAGLATGAICYDFDFPALGLALARLDIDLAVVPSSDWRGIDPIHTQMASVRAIEGGYSLLRSTRWGLSAGYDPYGRVRGWQSSFDSQAKILMVGLPVRGIDTLYTVIGDAFVGLCALVAAGLTAVALRQQMRVGRRQATFNPIPQQA